VCTGNPKTVLDMAVALRPDGGQHPEVVGGYRLDDIRHVFASPDRAKTDLGFEAKISFEEGMREFQTAELGKKVAERPERLRLPEN
jgi:dTDP-L-rhamnose 4-epimerase